MRDSRARKRAGRRARRRVIEQRLRLARSLDWWVWAGAVALAFAIVGVATLTAPTRFGWFVTGASIATIAWALFYVVVQLTNTSQTAVGAEAEVWTAQELRRLERRGWHVFHNVEFEFRDVDHVVVGATGVFAVETKWSSAAWHGQANRERLRLACLQSWRGEQELQRLLRSAEQPGRVDIEVVPVVALWGGDLADEAPKRRNFRRREVRVVDGRLLRDLIVTHPVGAVTPEDQARTAEKLRTWIDKRAGYERRNGAS